MTETVAVIILKIQDNKHTNSLTPPIKCQLGCAERENKSVHSVHEHGGD